SIPPQPPFQAGPPPVPPPPNSIQENRPISNQTAPTPPTGPDSSKDPAAENHTSTPPSQTPNPPPPAASSSPPKQNTDPVIQMLATRAAADPELKNLMKVVASSKATQEQLKLFQGHIDELNGIVERQKADKANKEQSNRPPGSNPKAAQPAKVGGPSD